MSVENNEAFASDSDDDDYHPSAEETDGQGVSSDEEKNKEKDSQSGATKRKSRKQLLPRKRKGGIKLKGEIVSENSEDDDDDDENDAKDSDADDVETRKVSGGKTKAQVDALWTDFKDSTSSTATNQVASSKPSGSQKKTVEKVYQFAGEEVKVNEVSSSKEEKNSSEEKTEAATSKAKTTANASQKIIGNSKFPIKKTGGLGSIMGKISGKAPKISTLEKSRLDWNSYKSDEGIDDDLSTFNKGKDGYLERQAFLQRADLRQFEIERNLRQNNRSNR